MAGAAGAAAHSVRLAGGRVRRRGGQLAAAAALRALPRPAVRPLRLAGHR